MNIMMVWLARNWKGTPFPKTDYIWYDCPDLSAVFRWPRVGREKGGGCGSITHGRNSLGDSESEGCYLSFILIGEREAVFSLKRLLLGVCMAHEGRPFSETPQFNKLKASGLGGPTATPWRLREIRRIGFMKGLGFGVQDLRARGDF